MRIGPNPRLRNPSIHLQLPQSGDENGDPPGRNRTARCGNPNPADWTGGSWSQRAARVAPRANAEVPPHPGRINSHPRIRNSSIYLQLQQTGDENGYNPGRYRSTRCGNPNRIGWLLIGWDSWSPRAARVAPRGNVEVPPHSGRIDTHTRIRNPSISLRIRQPGDENGDPPGRHHPAWCGNPSPTGWLLIGWGSWSQRCLLYTSPSPRDRQKSRMPSSA